MRLFSIRWGIANVLPLAGAATWAVARACGVV